MPTRKKPTVAIIPVDQVQSRILMIRGQRVIIAADLARLYGVTTKRLNQQVHRNAHRFPDDFMFQLTREEAEILRLQFATLRLPVDYAPSRTQIATLEAKHGKHVKYLPYAFTEHGAIMAATVLNSRQAVNASIFVVRAFVQLRQLLATHHELAAKLDRLEAKLTEHDERFVVVFDAIRDLMEDPDDPPKPPIGFQTEALGPPRQLVRRQPSLLKSPA